MRRAPRIGSVLLSAASLAALAAVCAGHRRELGATLASLSPAVIVLATLLHALVLAARAESWRLTLAAIERRAPSRRTVHGASAVGFAAGALETHLALPARMATLRRLAPHDSPRVSQMLLSDIPLMALEGFFAAALLLVAAGALPALPWWSVPFALAGTAGGVLALRLARERLSAHTLAGGLAVLEARDLRGRLAGYTAVIVALTLARISILLAACGIAADPAHVALTYIAVSVLGLLPVGPASNPAATIASAGAAGIAAATAAGLALAASTVAAVALYAAIVAAALRLSRLRPRAFPRPRGGAAHAKERPGASCYGRVEPM